jgi:tetratricopeptide (TPR) repeat protein
MALACASALPLGFQVRAAEPASLSAVAIPDGELQKALATAQQAIAAQDCAGALTVLDPLVPRLGDGPQRAALQRIRLFCLGVEGRATDIALVQRELAKSLPTDGLVRAYGILVAADENRYVDAASQLSALATSAPHSLEILTGQSVRAISLQLTREHAYRQRGEMLVALAKADWQPSDLPELRSSFAQGAIETLIANGKADEAAGLLDRIDQPEMLTSMATERRYAALWPMIEDRLGPKSAIMADRFARERLVFYANNPDAPAALRDATNAMLVLGRYSEVVEMTDNVVVEDGMGHEAVQTMMYRARALSTLKRGEEARKLLSSVAALNPQRTPDASSMIITFAEFLDDSGHEEEALAFTREAQAKATAVLSDFGRRWLDRTEVCALSALGRTAEANAAVDRMKLVSAQNQAATIEALLCAKRDAEATKIAIKAFDDSDMASNLVAQFQPSDSTWAPAPSRLRSLWLAFLARPDVKAAFERKGRILPRTLWPSPTPRAIPHSGGGSSLT